MAALNWQGYIGILAAGRQGYPAGSLIQSWLTAQAALNFVMMLFFVLYAGLDGTPDSPLSTLPIRQVDLRLGRLIPGVALVAFLSLGTSLGPLVATSQALRQNIMSILLLFLVVLAQILSSCLSGVMVLRLAEWGVSRLVHVSRWTGSLLSVTLLIAAGWAFFWSGQASVLLAWQPAFWLWPLLFHQGTPLLAMMAVVTVVLPAIGFCFVLHCCEPRWKVVETDTPWPTWRRTFIHPVLALSLAHALAFLRYRQLGTQLLGSALLGFALVSVMAAFFLASPTSPTYQHVWESVRSFAWLLAGLNAGLAVMAMSNIDHPLQWFFGSIPIKRGEQKLGRFLFYGVLALGSGLPWLVVLSWSLRRPLVGGWGEWCAVAGLLVCQAVLGYAIGRLLHIEFHSQVQIAAGGSVYAVVAMVVFYGIHSLAAVLTSVLHSTVLAYASAVIPVLTGLWGIAGFLDRRRGMAEIG